MPDDARARALLLRLTTDPHAAVRLGAVYGLSALLDADVLERLRELESQDVSRDVRLAAALVRNCGG